MRSALIRSLDANAPSRRRERSTGASGCPRGRPEMKKDKVLLNKATEPPGQTTQPSGGSASLPPELLREASVRLGWAGMIYAVAYLLAYWVPFFVHRTQHPEAPFAIVENFFAAGSILIGIAVFLISRYAPLPPERFLDVGLVFAVVGAFGISMAEFWRGFPPIQPTVFLGVPWECVWILIIPLVAPNLPRKVLIASLWKRRPDRSSSGTLPMVTRRQNAELGDVARHVFPLHDLSLRRHRVRHRRASSFTSACG